MSGNLHIEQHEIGAMKNYVYFIADRDSGHMAVVDPAWDVPEIIRLAEQSELQISSVFITHGHHDHVNGVEELLSHTDVPVYMHRDDIDFFQFQPGNIKQTLHHDQTDIGGLSVEFLHTPGHTPGSQCFLISGHLFAGDTLFIDACGRCDLSGGDPALMFDSIDKKLSKLPDQTLMFPGHNYHELKHSTIAREKAQNPYFQIHRSDDFITRKAWGDQN